MVDVPSPSSDSGGGRAVTPKPVRGPPRQRSQLPGRKHLHAVSARQPRQGGAVV